MRKIFLIFVIVLVGINSACTEKKQIIKSKPMAEYYPLKVGNFWEYYDKSHRYEYYLKKEVVAFGPIQRGIKAFKVKYLSAYTFFPDTVEHKNEWFTYQALIDNEIREYSDLNDTAKYEILLRLPLEVGMYWREPPKQMDSLVFISIFIDSVTAVENLTTPVGEFEDCYKIIKTSFVEGFDYFGQKRWFKPQVGFVKYWNAHGGLPFEYSLIDYKIIR
jgi:hypothetical protein